MTKRTHRIRLDDDDDDPEEPTHRPRRRLAREPALDRDDNPPPRQYVDGEYRTENLLRRMGAGRPKGSGNLVPRKITDSFLEAVERLGSDGDGKDGMVGYFMRACAEQPAAALTFASRLIPRRVQTSTDPDSALGQILDAARSRLQYAKAKVVEAQAIEGDTWRREYKR